MCVSVCMYTHACTSLFVYTYVCVYTYEYVCTYLCICVGARFCVRGVALSSTDFQLDAISTHYLFTWLTCAMLLPLLPCVPCSGGKEREQPEVSLPVSVSQGSLSPLRRTSDAAHLPGEGIK